LTSYQTTPNEEVEAKRVYEKQVQQEAKKFSYLLREEIQKLRRELETPKKK
jgi:hypothetical protein